MLYIVKLRRIFPRVCKTLKINLSHAYEPHRVFCLLCWCVNVNHLFILQNVYAFSIVVRPDNNTSCKNWNNVLYLQIFYKIICKVKPEITIARIKVKLSKRQRRELVKIVKFVAAKNKKKYMSKAVKLFC